ncbi:MAG: hypothetical protein ACRCZS_04425, partial [Chroococcidiopsis sp.]
MQSDARIRAPDRIKAQSYQQLSIIEISSLDIMANILHIDSSPRGDRSKSRQLAKKFIVAWQDLHPDD